MSYTDVFGNQTIPPAGAAYSELTLSANTTFVWPYNAADTDDAIAKIMDITCSAGVAMTFPPADEVTNGEDFLIRNVGAETLTIKDNGGSTIDTIAVGISKYYFVTDNSTAAGVWGKVTFGAGSSSATAGDLIGYGIKAASNTLNQAHPVTTDADNISIDATFRSKLVVSTGGACTVALAAVATLGDDFFFLYHNNGTGTATINPDGAETFDGSATFIVQPGESLIAVCSGAAWYSVGYGRSTLYQFTQLVKDVSVAGSFTLSASEASNKLLSFTGNPASAVTIVVPNTVAIYYCQSAISTAQTITVKTASGTGSAISQSARQILICDGTNVSSAQSAVATGSVTFDAGSAGAPSLNFTGATNTGLFLKGVNGVGVSANGVEVAAFESSGTSLAAPLAVTSGGTGRATGTTAYALVATGTSATGAQQSLAAGATTEILVGGGAAALPVWTTATGTGAPVRANAPALVAPDLGTPTALTLTSATGLPVATGISGLGTNVATALAVNVGSSGAFVVLAGALGQPSSGDLLNCTGMPQSGVIGLTTADSPQFAGINVGHASDTTITRASAGVIAVEGSNVLMASNIGSTVQAYDADTAKLDVAQSWTAQQTFKELKETVYTITDGAAFEIDPANGTMQKIVLGANRTPKATNFESGQSVLLKISDGTAYTITWTDGTLNPTWVGGTAPTLATSGYTWVVLWKDGDGMYATHIGNTA